MSDEHKAALALGREQGRIVRQYLEALEQHRPKRGRKRTPDSIKHRLAAIESQLPGADPLSRVHLIQERMDLSTELSAKETKVDLTKLEVAFAKALAAAGRAPEARKHLTAILDRDGKNAAARAALDGLK